MHIGWPQGILVVLLLLSLGLAIGKNGEPRGPYSGGAVFVSVIIELSLLYWGGFFSGR